MKMFDKALDYAKSNPGKVAFGVLSAAIGFGTGGIGIAIGGTAFGIPATGVAVGTGYAGSRLGGKLDERRNPRDPRAPGG